MNNIINITLVLFLCSFLAGCSQDEKIDGYKSEAAALCDVFNPKNWTDLPKNIEPDEIQKRVRDKLSAALKSDEMQKIINAIPHVKRDMRYQFYVEKISKLIHEPHECQAMKDYLTLQYK